MRLHLNSDRLTSFINGEIERQRDHPDGRWHQGQMFRYLIGSQARAAGINAAPEPIPGGLRWPSGCSTSPPRPSRPRAVSPSWRVGIHPDASTGTASSPGSARTSRPTGLVAYLNATTLQKRSAETDRFRAKALRGYFAGVELNTLDPSHIRGYVAWRRAQRVTDTTINRDLALLSAAI